MRAKSIVVVVGCAVLLAGCGENEDSEKSENGRTYDEGYETGYNDGVNETCNNIDKYNNSIGDALVSARICPRR